MLLFFTAVLLYGFAEKKESNEFVSFSSKAYTFAHSPNSIPLYYKIPAPWGYERLDTGDSFTEWLRNLPMKPKGSAIVNYQGEEYPVKDQFFLGQSAGVVDMNVLHQYEQCADMALRLRAEFLFGQHRQSYIKFPLKSSSLQYQGGRSRGSLEAFLVGSYSKINTNTIERDFKKVSLKEARPGDVIVQSSTSSQELGHLFMIIDEVENVFGQKKYLIGEGSTPAQSFHIMKADYHFSAWYDLNDFLKELENSDLGIAGMHRF